MSGATWEQTMLASQRGYVERQLEAGVPTETVAGDLARMGVDVNHARQFIASFGAETATQHSVTYARTPPAPVYGSLPQMPIPRPAVQSGTDLSILGAGLVAGVAGGLVMGGL